MCKNYFLLIVLSLSFICGSAQVEGIWQMSRQEVALGVGPTQGDFSWWSNSTADLTTRACFFDDQFVFEQDGTFRNLMGDTTWLETWQGVDPDQCGTPLAPHDGSNAATWAYDSAASTITLTGVGAHLGLPKVINGGEISDPANAPASITYPVVLNATEDTMTIDIDFGGGYWHYVLARTGSTGLDALKKDVYTFYPNPASSEIHIQTEQLMDQIILRDITGKSIMVKNNVISNEVLAVAALPRGLYILEFISDNKRAVEKVILN